MKLLDLFCGAGGCSAGYARAGFEVVGVDFARQPNYPFDFIEADALEYLEHILVFGHDFDAVHASPPCQAHSSLKARTRHIDHPELVGPTRELLKALALPYVIENVVGAPLEDPIMLCGSSFGLGVQRHRLFECTFPVMALPCAHGAMPKKFDMYQHGKWHKTAFAPVYGVGGGKAKEHWPEAMGIDWMTHPEMAQAIPPAYTEHIGGYLMEWCRLEVAA